MSASASKTFCWAVVVITIMLGLTSCGGSSHSSASEVALYVGKSRITQGEVEHQVAVLSAGRVPSQHSHAYQLVKDRAVKSLISAQWILQEGPGEHRPIYKSEVDRRLAEKEQSSFPGGRAELDEYLKQSDETRADLRREVELELALAKLHKGISESYWPATEAEIARYYALNRASFGLPELREVNIIDRKSWAAADAVRKRVERGIRFGSFSRTELATGTRGTGGHSPGSPLEVAIDRSNLHELVGPVKYRVDYLLFELKRLTPASYRPLSAVKAQIRHTLTAEKERDLLAQFVREWRARWLSQTECEPGYIVSKCREYNGPKVAENPLAIE